MLRGELRAGTAVTITGAGQPFELMKRIKPQPGLIVLEPNPLLSIEGLGRGDLGSKDPDE